MNSDTVMVRRRRRKSRFPAALALRVSDAMKTEIDALADALDEDAAEVVRQALEAGLPLLTQPDSGVPSDPVPGSGDDPQPEIEDKIQQWWKSQTPRERKNWGKRLRHIDGVKAFRAEAYRQAMADI